MRANYSSVRNISAAIWIPASARVLQFYVCSTQQYWQLYRRQNGNDVSQTHTVPASSSSSSRRRIGNASRKVPATN